MSVKNFVLGWRSLDDTAVSDDDKAKFAASMSGFYEEAVDATSPGPDLATVVDDCIEVSAFMISFFTGRTSDAPDLLTLYAAYVVRDGKVLVPQTRCHFLMQVMLACCLTLFLDESTRGLGREVLKTVRQFDDGAPRAETNLDVVHTDEWHRAIGCMVLTTQPVLDALLHTELMQMICTAAATAVRLRVSAEGAELDANKAEMQAHMGRVLDGYGPDWDASQTFAAIVEALPPEQIAIYTFAMWVLLAADE